MTLADRTNRIQPSQTLAVSALVSELRREGRTVIDLGAGEPDFETPQIVKDAAIRAIKEGFTHYTPAAGIPELKEVICERFQKDLDVAYDPQNIVVSCGAKHSVANVFLALCQSGDEVIIPAPYWTSYVEQVRFVDAKPVIIETDDSSEFKISPGQLQRAITPNTKILLLNSPSNPTGSVYTHSELSELAEILQKNEFYILSDEIYDKIIYDGIRHISLVNFVGLKDRMIVVNGVSKTYAMTGWRIGYLAADAKVAKAVAKIQSHTTSNPSSISQKASVAALKAGSDIYSEMVREFDRRRKFLADQLTAMPRITCNLPKGAFYMFPNVSAYYGCKHDDTTIENSIDLCSYLLKEAGVALVPGEAFGAKDYVRISYATSMNNLQDAVASLDAAFRKLLK